MPGTQRRHSELDSIYELKTKETESARERPQPQDETTPSADKLTLGAGRGIPCPGLRINPHCTSRGACDDMSWPCSRIR
jgi:hypothetical protein